MIDVNIENLMIAFLFCCLLSVIVLNFLELRRIKREIIYLRKSLVDLD